jgi:hypothetical protein
MAAGRGGPSTGLTTGLIMGGFLCLGLVLLAIAATVVLSLIGIYTSNHSQQGYGEQYQINALLLKIIHVNGSYRFLNGSVADSTAFSTLCSSIYRNNGAAYFSACVLDNFYAFGPYNDSTANKRRRRATGQNGTVIVGRARVFFSTTCASKKDRSKYDNATDLSKCAASRVAICNALFNTSSTTSLTEWKPLPDPFSLAAVDSNSVSYVVLTILRLFGFPTVIGLSIANSLGLNATTISYINAGCQYIGTISQSNIAAIVAAQSTETTTAPATTVMAAG